MFLLDLTPKLGVRISNDEGFQGFMKMEYEQTRD